MLYSLVPRPPPFFCSSISFSIIHESGRVRKTGESWERGYTTHMHANRRTKNGGGLGTRLCVVWVGGCVHVCCDHKVQVVR